MTKRLTAGMLAVLLLLLLALSACTGGGQESEKESGAVTDNTEEEDNERVTLTVGVPQNANVTDYNNNAFTKYLEEAANVDIEFVFFPSGSEDYIRQLTLMAAGNEKLPDVIWGFTGLGNNARNEFGEDGYFLDISELIETKAPNLQKALAAVDEHTRERVLNRMTAEDGSMYGFPMFMSMEVWDDLQDMLFINQEWLDNLGLETPKTADDLYKVLKAFKEEDPNGNGLPDEIPIFGNTKGAVQNITAWIVNAFVYYNYTYDLNVTDGKLWAPYVTDEYREALIFMNKLCKEGLFSDLSFSAGNPEMKAMVTPPTGVSQVGIWAGHPSVVANQESPILEEYSPYAGLGDETGKGGYVVQNPTGLYFPLIITTDCEHVNAAMRFCDLFYLDETVTRQRHGEKDVDWVVEEGTLPTGEPGYIKLLNSNAFFKGDRTWCQNGGGALTGPNYLVIMEATRKTDEVLNNLAKRTYDEIMANIEKPEEVLEDIIYSADLYEQRMEYRSQIMSHILEQRNLFILGTIDPNSDDDWNAYLKKLDQLGLDEYIDVMQRAYDAQK